MFSLLAIIPFLKGQRYMEADRLRKMFSFGKMTEMYAFHINSFVVQMIENRYCTNIASIAMMVQSCWQILIYQNNNICSFIFLTNYQLIGN